MQVLSKSSRSEHSQKVGGAKRWLKATLGPHDVEYLPEIRILGQQDGEGEGAAAHAHGGGGSGGDDGAVKISLLCSNGFDVAAQLPAGLWMTSREECESGTHSWYDICVKEIPSHPVRFKESARTLFNWFKRATMFDKNAILEFPPVLSSAQRKEMHDLGTKIGLAHNSYGPKSARCLMICSNLQALKHIQKRGGVHAVASAASAAPVTGAARMQAAIGQGGGGGGLRDTVKCRLYDILLRYHPQGLLMSTLASEYENEHGHQIPLSVCTSFVSPVPFTCHPLPGCCATHICAR
jgi:hypothetical protein